MRKQTLILLLILSNSLFAQKIEILNQTNSNLPTDELLCVAITKDGKEFIGTSKTGFGIFNNNEFIPFTRENFNELKGDYVSPIFVDSKNRVWIAYSNPTEGLLMLDGKNWNSIETPQSSIISICEDKNGNLYFAGDGGVSVFNGKIWNKLKLPLNEVIVRAITCSENGDLAIGHNDGLLIFKNDKWENYTEENSELVLSVVRAVKYDKTGALYIGYGGGYGNGGFSILNNKKWTHYNKSNSKISDHMVRDIEFAPDGTVWLASNDGLNKFDGINVTSVYFNKGKYSNMIMDISIINSELILATTTGLIRYAP